jgi:hypothetical protein
MSFDCYSIKLRLLFVLGTNFNGKFYNSLDIQLTVLKKQLPKKGFRII